MGATTRLVGTKKVGAQDGGVFFGDKDFMARRGPIREGLVALQVGRKGVGVAGANGGLEYGPDNIGVV